MIITRRGALALACGSTTAAILPRPAPARPYDAMLIVNSLGYADDPYAPRSDVTTDHSPFISDAGLAAALRSGVTGFNYSITGSTSFAPMIFALDRADAYLASHGDKVIKALSAADIVRAKREGKIAIVYGFQNAAMVEKDARNVDVFADRGVRIIQLTYNSLNQLGGGSLVPGEVGLTPFGREVVDRLNARRVMVDLAHSGRAICLDAARTSKQPICISHTGCRALAETPRNKTDEELRLIAERGGYVGIYFMPFVAPGRAFSSEDVANHIDHAIQVCGEDHVGIGSDTGMSPPGDLASARRYFTTFIEMRRRLGISAPGEDPDRLPYGTDLIGPDQFRTMAATLARRGYKPARIEKILGGNFLRYARTIWGE